MRTKYFEAFWVREKCEYGENFPGWSSDEILRRFNLKYDGGFDGSQYYFNHVVDYKNRRIDVWFQNCRIGDVWENDDYKITCDLFDRDRYEPYPNKEGE